MASTLIHAVIASEINKTLKKDNTKLLLGSIAPDISKLVGESRDKSHFNKNEIPDIGAFLKKYQKNLNDDFVLGYYIHLYTDYLWRKYFIPEILDSKCIKKLDGTLAKIHNGMEYLYIYNDYTNLNQQLINKYDIDLGIFYNDIPKLDNIIKEIPMDKLYVLVDKAGIMIANSKTTKNYVFDISSVERFITTSTDLILADCKEKIDI